MKKVAQREIKKLKASGVKVEPTSETKVKRVEEARVKNTNKAAKYIVSAIRSVGMNLVAVLGKEVEEVKVDPPEVVVDKKEWNFTVARDGKGFIKSIKAREI